MLSVVKYLGSKVFVGFIRDRRRSRVGRIRAVGVAYGGEGKVGVEERR